MCSRTQPVGEKCTHTTEVRALGDLVFNHTRPLLPTGCVSQTKTQGQWIKSAKVPTAQLNAAQAALIQARVGSSFLTISNSTVMRSLQTSPWHPVSWHSNRMERRKHCGSSLHTSQWHRVQRQCRRAMFTSSSQRRVQATVQALPVSNLRFCFHCPSRRKASSIYLSIHLFINRPQAHGAVPRASTATLPPLS